jgi:flagellum-specific peptidoglycan hydrolase FlgJ
MSLQLWQLTALKAAADAAVKAEDPFGVPALLTVSQWADESGWGQHQPGNNPFGIKATPGEAYTRKLTHEFIGGKDEIVEQDFESFPTLADAFARHSELISQGTYFEAAFDQYQQDQDFPALVRNVAAHYATAPNYADVILAISRMPEVQAAIAEARTA